MEEIKELATQECTCKNECLCKSCKARQFIKLIEEDAKEFLEEVNGRG